MDLIPSHEITHFIRTPEYTLRGYPKFAQNPVSNVGMVWTQNCPNHGPSLKIRKFLSGLVGWAQFSRKNRQKNPGLPRACSACESIDPCIENIDRLMIQDQ